jgi:hypothetical protein
MAVSLSATHNNDFFSSKPWRIRYARGAGGE